MDEHGERGVMICINYCWIYQFFDLCHVINNHHEVVELPVVVINLMFCDDHSQEMEMTLDLEEDLIQLMMKLGKWMTMLMLRRPKKIRLVTMACQLLMIEICH